jgi:hypothetical protein
MILSLLKLHCRGARPCRQPLPTCATAGGGQPLISNGLMTVLAETQHAAAAAAGHGCLHFPTRPSASPEPNQIIWNTDNGNSHGQGSVTSASSHAYGRPLLHLAAQPAPVGTVLRFGQHCDIRGRQFFSSFKFLSSTRFCRNISMKVQRCLACKLALWVNNSILIYKWCDHT